jgi:hypothetical protein
VASLFLGLAALACPVGMGVMMWMMGRRWPAADNGSGAEVAALRAEIEDLKAERHPRETAS